MDNEQVLISVDVLPDIRLPALHKPQTTQTTTFSQNVY